MTQNVGTLDKIVRIIVALGIAIAWAAGYIGGVLAIVLLVIAGILLFTSMIGVCPLYLPFHISTKR